MHGDFSRSTFSPTHGYREVLLQQGRVLLDADWNEQTRVTAHHDEVRTLDVVGRSGGPLPQDDGPGPFAILAADGTVPGAVPPATPTPAVPWSELVVTPGRYYVDGVLCESWPPGGAAAGWSLTDQPYLRRIGSGVTAVPGLEEPPASADGTRYALYLEVSEHQVTADEDPSLRESALGGPDTTTRAQTTWQVRWEQVAAAVRCSDLHAPAWLERSPRTMVAALRAAEDDADPCRITTTGGYRRLENQLYRVQIHQEGTEPTYLWSRENGSVVARLLAVTASVLPDVDVVLTLDRVGRDEELSFREGDLVEVTSTDRQQRRLPGFLARAGSPDGVEVPVSWLDAAPTSLAVLGRAPVVRRWEGGPTELSTTAADLEDGITVRFPAGGQPRVGDYWLIPARSVRLAYGLSELRGTIDWPQSGGVAQAVRPSGPPRQVAPLAIMSRSGGLWTRESDCRLLFPPLTGLVTLDLVGGDGQEDLPGEWLDEPVRVVVRAGNSPVTGAPVRFTATAGGRLSAGTGAPGGGSAGPLTVPTDEFGVAVVRWRLDAGGSTTQTLRVQRLDDHHVPTDVEVVATARLSLASEVAWTADGCAGFADVTTVDGALGGLVRHLELRLRGGDGQHLPPGRRVLPQPVRVIVDSPCGPFEGMPVNALATGGALVQAAEEGVTPPADLTGTGDITADSMSGPGGGALFWWQPDVSSGSDILEIRMPGEDLHDPITVVAQPGHGRRSGLHLLELRFGSSEKFLNDEPVAVGDLVTGIEVVLDGFVDPGAVKGKPVLRVELELPWPAGRDGDAWSERPVGTRTVTLEGGSDAEERLLRWSPSDRAAVWLQEQLWSVLESLDLGNQVLGRFLLDGWALPSVEPEGLHVNTHADSEMVRGRTHLRLPTDDEVTGGTFTQWFWLVQSAEVRPDFRVVPDVLGMTVARARAALAEAGITIREERREGVPGFPRGRVAVVEPAVGTELTDRDEVVLVISTGG